MSGLGAESAGIATVGFGAGTVRFGEAARLADGFGGATGSGFSTGAAAFRAVDRRGAVFLAAVLPGDAFFRPVFLAAVFFGAVFFAAVFFTAGFLAGLLAAALLAAVLTVFTFLAVVFLVAVFFVAAFFAAAFFTGAFLAAFLSAVFFTAAAFFAAATLVVFGSDLALFAVFAFFAMIVLPIVAADFPTHRGAIKHDFPDSTSERDLLRKPASRLPGSYSDGTYSLV